MAAPVPLISKVLLTFSLFMTGLGCFYFDWDKTHVFNPKWPPHAKFHNGQTMSFGAALGLSGLWYLYTPGHAKATLKALSPATRMSVARQRFRFTVLIASLYWITQASAIYYPGTMCVDPEFGAGCPQVMIDTVLLTCNAIAWGMGEYYGFQVAAGKQR